MTEHVSFLEQLPVRAVLDGEIVACDSEGKLDFPLVCEAVLHRDSEISHGICSQCTLPRMRVACPAHFSFVARPSSPAQAIPRRP
jgi:hypothetical protein